MAISYEVIIIGGDSSIDFNGFLHSLLSQTIRPSKVTMFCDEHSTEKYGSIAGSFSSLNIDFNFYKANYHVSLQKNIGISKGLSDCFFFTDENILLHDRYFEEALNFLEIDSNKKVGGLTGEGSGPKSKISVFENWFNWFFILPRYTDGMVLISGFANKINYSITQSCEIEWLPNSNMLIRKEVFENHWFDENLAKVSCYDDLDLSLQIKKKFKLYYLKTAKFSKDLDHCCFNTKEEAYHSIININYIFKKNFLKKKYSRIAHYHSLIGLLIKSLIINRSYPAFAGAMKGFLEIILLKNFTMPIYLERLDFSDHKHPSIAEHFIRYEFAANFCKDKLVLDCASGEGIGMNILCRVAKSVMGVDIDENTFNTAKRNIHYANASFTLGSAIELPFPEGYFDIVTSMETIEHIPQRYQEICIKEFYRVLKQGGKLIISTPNKSVLNPTGIAPRNYFHIWELEHKELRELLGKYFNEVIPHGLFNPIRDKVLNDTSMILGKPNKLSFKKVVLLIMPVGLKNFISKVLYKRTIYPLKSEYVIDSQKTESARNIIFVATK